MLVLSRKAMEAIAIGDDIKIVVVDVRRKRVQLAIEAPQEFSVRRTHAGNQPASGDSHEPQDTQACPAP